MKSNTTSGRSVTARTTAWLLCLLYLLFSVGIVKATHFCMGREASVSYFTVNAEKCPCSLFAKEKDNCCDDEHDLLKLEDSQKTFTTFSLTAPAFICVGEIYNVAIGSNGIKLWADESAADLQQPPRPLYEVYCSLVFYDEKSFA